MKWIICAIRGHRFVVRSLGKRHCDRCHREEWLMRRPHWKIGRAEHNWQRVWIDRRK